MPAAPDKHGRYCGYITILGRPNVGKSTLLNRLLGQKLSITSRKPQTTRRRLIGIKTGPDHQAIYIDTPGLQARHKGLLNRFMNKEASNALIGIDVILFVVDALHWTYADEHILGLLGKIKTPVILAVNKADKIKDKALLLPFIERLSGLFDSTNIIPISAKKAENLEQLEGLIRALLPTGHFQFPKESITDRNEQFFAAEFIREKLTQKLGKELPYQLSVTIEQFFTRRGIRHIQALIWTENENHKRIIIGRHGLILKSVGEQARKDMEKLFGGKVYLQTWVKIKKKWTRDASALARLGYTH